MLVSIDKFFTQIFQMLSSRNLINIKDDYYNLRKFQNNDKEKSSSS